MKRRCLLIGLLGLGLAQGARFASAQAIRRSPPFRIVVFPDMAPIVRQMLSTSMREIGWSIGRDVVVRDSGVPIGAPHLAQEVRKVVDSAPDLILTYSSSYALALHRATVTIPIVMWTSGYPVEVGVAHSLARPGKNVTGNTQYAGTGVWGKMLELLRDAKPGLRRIGVYWGYVPPAFPKEEVEPCYREIRLASDALGISTNIVEVAAPEHVSGALARIDAAKPEALLLTTNPALWESRRQVMEFAKLRRLPTVVDFVWPVTEELYPLLTFAPPTADLIGRAVATIDRIRKGAKPGDLPIQLPSKFELLVSSRTAKSIGLRFSQSFLLRADRVIE